MDTPLRRVNCEVVGVAPGDRNFLGGMMQRHLRETQQIDLWIDWSGGDSGTADVRIVVDCCEFSFPRIRAGMATALEGTYLAGPLIAPKNDLSRVVA